MKIKSIKALLGLPGATWRHPWQVTPAWNGSAWAASIMPGLVNGDDATVSIGGVDVRLSDLPSIPLTSFRAIGSDADPADATEDDSGDGSLNVTFETVPPFFAAKGVAAPAPISSAAGSDTVDTSNNFVPAGACLLRACDLVMNMDQPATATQISTSAGVGSAPIVQVSNTVITAPNARTLAYITATSQFVAPAPPDPTDQLSGNYAGPTTDSFLLATVYLLSLPNAAPGSVPDMTWTAYVAHQPGAFWSLAHILNQPTQPPTSDLSLDTGLLGGIGDSTNDFLLGQVNQGNSQAAQFLQATTLTGVFYNV